MRQEEKEKLTLAIANPGFKPLGQVLEQFMIVWHLYRLISFSSAILLCGLNSSLESASHL